jgi:pimeloyl-ACP methyl ester carboxylesterase
MQATDDIGLATPRRASRQEPRDPALLRSRVHMGYDIKLYVAEPHSLEKPSVVFIHGMMEGWEIWKQVYPSLLATRNVYFLEFPWIGRQDNRWGLRAEPQEWIREGLDLLPYGAESAVAHSFGANALLEHLCSRGANSLRSVALISPFYKRSPEGFDWGMFTHYVANLGRFMDECLLVRQNGRPMPMEILAAVSAKVKDQLGVLGWLHFFNLFTRTPALDLRVPNAGFLVLGGEDDFSALAADCRDLAGSLPDSRLFLLPHCGHFCMLQRPEAVRDILTGFLAPRSDS